MKALATTSDEHFRASSAEYIRHPHAPCKTPGGVAEVHPHSKQMGERRSANGLAPPWRESRLKSLTSASCPGNKRDNDRGGEPARAGSNAAGLRFACSACCCWRQTGPGGGQRSSPDTKKWDPSFHHPLSHPREGLGKEG